MQHIFWSEDVHKKIHIRFALAKIRIECAIHRNCSQKFLSWLQPKLFSWLENDFCDALENKFVTIAARVNELPFCSDFMMTKVQNLVFSQQNGK